MKWLLLLLLFPVSGFAINYNYLLRSPRGLLMGDAFTAVNDDEYTLFYNPASLARHKADLTLYPLNMHLTGTNVIDDLDRFEDDPEGASDVSAALMDFPFHGSLGTAPGFKLFNIGVTFLANENVDVMLRNRAHPMLDIDFRSDRGVLMGIGIPLGSSRINKKSQTGSQTSLGISAKYIERTGIQDSVALAGPTVLNAVSQDEIEDLFKSLGQVKGRGWGYDAGLEHVQRNGNTKFVFGLAALDITGTEFEVDSNPDNLKVANTDDQINLGFAAGQDYSIFHYILSADIRSLNQQMDFGQRFRFGAEVGVTVLKVMFGVNSGYYSYGATLDLGFMELTLGLYDMEIGTSYKQIKSKRAVLYLSLFDFSFDA